MSGFYLKNKEIEIPGKIPEGEKAPGITITNFIDTQSQSQQNTKDTIPIDGFTLNKNVSCNDCSFYKQNLYDGYIYDECNHVENNHYTYDYQGKHKHKMWEPENKNSEMNCELWEKKKTIMQNIKIRLGMMK